jgi:WhiB family redox-sensing transcriptional regulator
MARRDEEWKDQAACRGEDPELFFVERGDDAGEAKRICRECPVRLRCLEYALAIKEKHGIWGGLGEHERRRYAQRKAAS